jgi:predicted O-methyltransferase YrrM
VELVAVKLVARSDLGVTGTTSRKYMQPGEENVLLALVQSIQPRIMVEIGVNEGLTAQAVLRHVASIEHYYGVDVDAAYQFEIPAQRSERPTEPGRLVKHDPRFHLVMRGDLMPDKADVVFIDGDHGKRAVLADSIWAASIVTPGGLIIWHDYGNPTVEVTGALNRLGSQGRALHHVEGTWLVFEPR